MLWIFFPRTLLEKTETIDTHWIKFNFDRVWNCFVSIKNIHSAKLFYADIQCGMYDQNYIEKWTELNCRWRNL